VKCICDYGFKPAIERSTPTFPRKGPRWPVIDTTNGGVEETAAKARLDSFIGASQAKPVEVKTAKPKQR